MNLENYVAQIIEAGDVTNAAENFDLGAIVEELQGAGYYYSDIAQGTEIPDEVFWSVVEKHAL